MMVYLDILILQFVFSFYTFTYSTLCVGFVLHWVALLSRNGSTAVTKLHSRRRYVPILGLLGIPAQVSDAQGHRFDSCRARHFSRRKTTFSLVGTDPSQIACVGFVSVPHCAPKPKVFLSNIAFLRVLLCIVTRKPRMYLPFLRDLDNIYCSVFRTKNTLFQRGGHV